MQLVEGLAVHTGNLDFRQKQLGAPENFWNEPIKILLLGKDFNVHVECSEEWGEFKSQGK